jgi:hypothetical protein
VKIIEDITDISLGIFAALGFFVIFLIIPLGFNLLNFISLCNKDKKDES